MVREVLAYPDGSITFSWEGSYHGAKAKVLVWAVGRGSRRWRSEVEVASGGQRLRRELPTLERLVDERGALDTSGVNAIDAAFAALRSVWSQATSEASSDEMSSFLDMLEDPRMAL